MLLKRLWIVLIFFGAFSRADTLHLNVSYEHQLHVKYARSYKMGWHILQQAAKRSGIELDAKESIWIRSISFLKQKKGVTLVFGAMPSKERAAWTTFSAPLAVEHIAAYSRLNSPHYNFEDLLKFKQHITIGAGRGTIHQDIAERFGFKYIHTFTNQAKMFEMLEVGKLDAIIFTQAITSFYCGKFKNLSGDQCVKRLGKPIENSTLHFMYDKSDKRTAYFVNKLHEQLNHMYRSGELKKRFLQGGYQLTDYQFWQAKYLNWLNLHK